MSGLFSAQTKPNKLPELLIKFELSRSPCNGRQASFCVWGLRPRMLIPRVYILKEMNPREAKQENVENPRAEEEGGGVR